METSKYIPKCFQDCSVDQLPPSITYYHFEMTNDAFLQMGNDLIDFVKVNRVFGISYSPSGGKQPVELSLSEEDFFEFKRRLAAKNDELYGLMGRS